MRTLKTLLLTAALALVLSGCATSQSAQKSNDTTVSGYISTGAQKNW